MLPLHAWLHKMCDMSHHKDPCLLSTVELPPSKVAARVNAITSFWLDEEAWRFGMEPFHRGNAASSMSFFLFLEVSHARSRLPLAFCLAEYSE